jgi:hypothetical protein
MAHGRDLWLTTDNFASKNQLQCVEAYVAEFSATLEKIRTLMFYIEWWFSTNSAYRNSNILLIAWCDFKQLDTGLARTIGK